VRTSFGAEARLRSPDGIEIEGTVMRARTRFPAVEFETAPAWGIEMLAGRLVELSGGRASAVLTAAFGLVLDAQRRDEPVAWITAHPATFYPPDAAQNGVDLAALVVVRLAQTVHVARAADHLARSSAFGLLVLDLGADPRLPMAVQARLASLAQKHAIAIVCLTERSSVAATAATPASLGSLVSLRADAERVRRGPGSFACRLRITKDKQHGPGWEHVESCNGPAGVR
jgi:recombination protein RecA